MRKKNHLVQSTVFNEFKNQYKQNILKLMRRHFPNRNPLHKIFDKNTLRFNYSCMGKMASIISSHNHTIINPDVSL